VEGESLRRAVAEFVGAFALVLVGAGSVMTGGGLLAVAVAHGLILAIMVTAVGHISGGHFNPAVSLGLAAARKFPPKEVLPYWLAQLVGGFVAVIAVALVYTGSAVDALDNAPGVGISNGGALLLELIATALFVIVICTVATDDRAPWKGVMAPLLIGLFIFTAAVAIGPASGGSFNPARSVDPAVFNGNFDDLWIYLLGPLVGGVIGGLCWNLFGPTPENEPDTIRATGGLPQSGAADGSG
jgi:aquaporin Z